MQWTIIKEHTMTSVYDFTVTTINGGTQSLGDYRGEVLLVVNTATRCSFTPQLEGLESLQRAYHDQGFEVLGFPCNQFANQAPESDEEIGNFCRLSYGVDFPTFAKIDVNGKDADPLFVWLRQQKGGALGNAIKWNFTKFLIDRNGQVVARYAPTTKPENLENDIKALL